MSKQLELTDGEIATISLAVNALAESLMTQRRLLPSLVNESPRSLSDLEQYYTEKLRFIDAIRTKILTAQN